MAGKQYQEGCFRVSPSDPYPERVIRDPEGIPGKQIGSTIITVSPNPTVTGLKDSGARAEFGTGAVRDVQAGKGKPSLVPNWVIWLVSRIYEDGAKKYADRNWEKGIPLGTYLDSAERHLAKLKAGLRDEPHASQVIWNMIGYVFTATLIKLGLRPKELNNMPDQFSSEPGAVAEPLSPYEYESLSTFLGRKI